MAELKINADIRKKSGKGVARKLRQSGRIPAIFYHSGSESVSLSLDLHEVTTMMNNPQGLLQLEIKGGNSELAIVKNYDLNPITDDIIHVDFMGVTRGEEFQTNVPIRIVGEATGVKLGGVMEQLVYDLDISVLPANLPDAIEIDVSPLEVGDTVQVKDLDQSKFRIFSEDDLTIVQVIVAREYEEEEEEVAEGEAEEGAIDEEGAESDESSESDE